MKRVHCLYRVSTKGQVDVIKDDIPMQKIACHEFAERNGWVIHKEYCEKGISGSKVHAEKRDAIQSLKQDAINGDFDVLLVYMFDRIGRIDDETPFVVEWFVQHGIEVWSVQEGEQRFDSHVDKLMNYIRFWQASGESAKTSMRIKTRMRQLVEEGNFTRGVAPFGYKLVKRGRLNKKGVEVSDMVIDEEEAEYVRELFDKCVKEGYGSYMLAEYLNNKGVRTHKGAKFSPMAILRILGNKAYCGYYEAGGVTSPKVEEIVIVDEAIWEKAQLFLEQRKTINEKKRSVSKTAKGQTLLAGNVYCAKCGCRLTSTAYTYRYTKQDGETTEKRVYRNVCYHASRKLNECKGQSFYDALKVDGIITNVVKDMFSRITSQPEKMAIERKLKTEIADLKKEQKQQTLLLERLNAQKNKLQQEIANCLIGMSKFSEDDLAPMLKDVKTKIPEVENRLAEIDEEVENRKKNSDKLIPIYQQFVSWADEFERLPLAEKRTIVSHLVERVEVGENYKINITLKLDYEQFCNYWSEDVEAV